MNKYVIIVAGGKGKRMGADLPKQFLPLAGRPVLMHTLEAFQRAIADIHIILVLPKDQQNYWKELCTTFLFQIQHEVADGGDTRFQSVFNGLSKIPESVTEALVGVHDGVRPLVSTTVIQQCYEAAQQHQAVIPVIPIYETVRELQSADTDLNTPSHTVNRDAFRLVQTPQTFTLSLLRRAYQQPYKESFTDDASVIETLGHTITLIPGNRENIKLTTPYDLIIAEATLTP